MSGVSPNGASQNTDQALSLDEALKKVEINKHRMRNCLDNNKLMDGLKHCSTMLVELRTSEMTPKTYYELYLSVFNALGDLTNYLTEAHQSGRHHLADLYELVQYAGNMIPRLYLMITVGAAYMSMPDAPVGEIMRDMMEMTRGVQHPIRGLFLRDYLSKMTRNNLPIGESSGPEGNVHESIKFILTNFTEMNKLWVRLQHQGHSRDREKRECERRQIQLLVGMNLNRLSQLEGVDLQMYTNDILPGILAQVVNCRDVIAQEYLMEAVTQAFPDDFHLRTLEPFLTATAQLHPKVNVKQIIISLIDRLTEYASREAEVESTTEEVDAEEEEKKDVNPEDQVPKEETDTNTATTDKQAEDEKTDADTEKTGKEADADDEEKGVLGENSPEDVTKEETEEVTENAEEEAVKEDEAAETEAETATKPDSKPDSKPEVIDNKALNVKKIRGIPEDLELFEVFWGQIIELVKARPDLTIQDLTALLVSLVNLSLSCYPEKLDYVDQILAYAKEKYNEFTDSADLHSKITLNNLMELLKAPITRYSSVLTLLELENYQSLLDLQPFSTRQTIAQTIVESMLKNTTIIDTPEKVNAIFELCGVLLRGQKDGPATYSNSLDDLAREQGSVAKVIHLLRSENDDTQFLLLSAAKKKLGDGGKRIRYTFPPLIVSVAKLARRYKEHKEKDDIWEKKMTALFRFIHQALSTLNRECECADICLQLNLLSALCADENDFEDIAYEFFVEAFTIYEESISGSRAQYQAITSIIATLQQTHVFSADSYDTLSTKATLHSSKLLKKPDQCRGVYLASHLWWRDEREEEKLSKDEESGKDATRVLKNLQKAMDTARSCMEAATRAELFVEILNQYIYYFEKGNVMVTIKYLNDFIDLINTTFEEIEDNDQSPPPANSSSLVQHKTMSEHVNYVKRHYAATAEHLARRKATSPRYKDIKLDE